MTFTEQAQAIVETYIQTHGAAICTWNVEKKTTQTLPTSFGDIEVDATKYISFDHGLPGFEEACDFALASLPNPDLKSYLLLQSLQSKELTFITLPIDPSLNLIAEDDLLEASQACGCAYQNALFLLLVSIYPQGDDRPQITANVRAPLVIDVKTRKGIQHIFSNAAYPTRFQIN